MLKLTVLICAFLAVVGTASATDLEHFLIDKVIADYGLDPAFTEVSLVRTGLITEDLTGCEIKAYPMTQGKPRGRFPMLVELWRDGELMDKGSASLDVKVYAELLVPVRNIGRHEILDSKMFRFEKFDVTSLTEELLSDNDFILGCRAKHNLTAGRKVSMTRVEKIPIVEQGQPVTIVGSGQFFDIRAKGVALEDGNTGEKIRVKNVDSRKILSVEVTASDTVRIAL